MNDSRRIVLLVDEYLPESRRSHAKMMHHLAKEFVAQGHKVMVITPGPHLMAEQLWAVEYVHGVEVLRIRSLPLRGVGNVRRTIAETLLPFNTLRALRAGAVVDNFDICVNYSPTIFWGLVARWFGKRGAKTYLVLRDLFPQWLIDEKLIGRFGIAACYFRLFERINYAVSDVIGVQSPNNVQVFKDLVSFSSEKVEVLFNWTADVAPTPVEFGKNLASQERLSGKVIIFYGGAIGASQNIDILLDLAIRIQDLRNVAILIVGEGGEYSRISQRIVDEKISNVTIHPAILEADYISILRQVDVGFITLKGSHRSHNIPGKIMSYLQVGLPILGVVNEGNDLLEMVEKANVGMLAVGDDLQTLEVYTRQTIERLDADRDDNLDFRAKALADRVFSVKSAALQILGER